MSTLEHILPWSGFSNPGCFSRLHKHHVLKASCCYSRSAINASNAIRWRKWVNAHWTLTFEDIEKRLNLPPEVLQSYLQRNVIKLCSKENITSFKDSLLFIEKVDYFPNTKIATTHIKKQWPTLYSFPNFTYNIYFLET